MRRALKRHPDTPCNAVASIEVEALRPEPERLRLRFEVRGDLSAVNLPPRGAPMRGDRLWQHSCFEAFLRTPSSTAYYELNFAPSTRWAAYRFSDYRQDMTVAQEIDAPQIDLRLADKRIELQAAVTLTNLCALPSDASWQLGLSAVIEEIAGRKSYWALAHPPGKPDFHHSDCFALGLPTD